jgi:hypothetical protein
MRHYETISVKVLDDADRSSWSSSRTSIPRNVASMITYLANVEATLPEIEIILTCASRRWRYAHAAHNNWEEKRSRRTEKAGP